MKRFPLAVSTAVLGLAISGAGGSAAAQQAADHPATHNMLMIGEETVYLSHLPMFQEPGEPPMPHRYQAILEVTFPSQESYAKDRRAHRSTSIYTLNPEEFVLPDLVSSDPRRKPLASFVRVVKELYFEEGELRMPPTFDTTPEEKRAGFP